MIKNILDKKSGKLYIYPIEDPDHLDIKRKSMGLIPMKEYAAIFHMEWNVDAYKQMIPEIEKIAKEHQF